MHLVIASDTMECISRGNGISSFYLENPSFVCINRLTAIYIHRDIFCGSLVIKIRKCKYQNIDVYCLHTCLHRDNKRLPFSLDLGDILYLKLD